MSGQTALAVAARRGQQISKTVSVPAPVGGLNARDPLANMPPTDAVILDNWFPDPSSISVRNGSLNWATGLPGWVETLMNYRSASTHKLFAISGTAVYDATSSGAIGASVKSGLTNARWEWHNLETPAGQYLRAGNAVDKPLHYDGAAWVSMDGASTPAITGVTTTKLRNPITWKNREWWIEDASTRAWYLPVQSIAGAANSIDVGTYFELGGQLQALFPMTFGTGNYYDDFLCFLSSEGELVIYQGTDPATAGLFSIQGRYRLGRPIGRRCWFRYGPDIIIINADGFTKLSQIISHGDIGADQTISDKIRHLVTTDTGTYPNNFGWEGVLFPAGNKVLINVPVSENVQQYQYCLNTITNAWSRFTQWNAACFCVDRDSLYYGGNTVVVQADTGQFDTNTDNTTAAILASVVPAFSYMDYQGQKHFEMVRPILFTTGGITALLSINTDFNIVTPTGTPSFSTDSGSGWGVYNVGSVFWDVAFWQQGYTIQKNWQGAPGIGFTGTCYITLQSSVAQIQLTSIDYLYSQGGVL